MRVRRARAIAAYCRYARRHPSGFIRLLSRWFVCPGNLSSLFCDTSELTRWPGAHSFYFRQRATCRGRHAYGYCIRSVGNIVYEHDIVRACCHIKRDELAARFFDQVLDRF